MFKSSLKILKKEKWKYKLEWNIFFVAFKNIYVAIWFYMKVES
jgi:hypothetical protein